MSNPFDYVTSITYSKKDIISGADDEDLMVRNYPPFIVNKALSYFADTVLHANEMNINHQLSNKTQYLFLLNSIRRRKRFAKWVKAAVPDNEIEAICLVYECNARIAEQYRGLMNKAQTKSIMKLVETGGHKKK
ncbi:MAG: DNA polymerase [Robiginitomaculum sp.]|nr:MAG: DNA polymerase [Robiginitomaculum sp.]